MSWKEKGIVPCPKALLFSPNISATDLKIYLVIRAHRNRVTGKCFPSIPTIAEETGMGKATIKRARNRLKKIGILNWVTDKRQKNSSSYDFPLERGSESDRERLCDKSQGAHQRPHMELVGSGGSPMTPLRAHQRPHPITPEKQAESQAGCGSDTDCQTAHQRPPNKLTKRNNKKTIPQKRDNGETDPLGEVGSPFSDAEAKLGEMLAGIEPKYSMSSVEGTNRPHRAKTLPPGITTKESHYAQKKDVSRKKAASLWGAVMHRKPTEGQLDRVQAQLEAGKSEALIANMIVTIFST